MLQWSHSGDDPTGNFKRSAMSSQMQALKTRLGTIADLDGAAELASWDQQTKMPPNGSQARADVLGTLASLRHEAFTDDQTGRLLESAAAELDGGASPRDPDSDDARLIEVTRRRWEKSRRVPAELEAEIARASSEGQEAWVAARAASDFKGFAPYLERILELTRRYVDCHVGHDRFDSAYDVLIDDYEPGIRTARVADLFSELKGELVPMIATLAQATPVDDRPLSAQFAIDGQRTLARETVALMGFDEQGWRMDDTVHPFAVRIGPGDVRITNRWDEAYWPMSLYGAMHECGHGLYEAGIAPELRRTPIGSPQSLGVHESQSRLWENMVGRGRAFCNVLAPRISELAGGDLAGIDADRLYRAINRVKPTYIRVEADEATYALHIILRFELEQELIEGRLSIADLPEAWNARFKDYFGIEVTDDADGVLQDVHWSAGLIGYFPTYALGNLIAGQLWEAAQGEIAGLNDQLAAGELAELREWLRRRIHRHGAKFGTEELLEREGGGPISVAPFVRYLKAKLSDVYGVDLGD
jgi:carboxypeptidase Taq